MRIENGEVAALLPSDRVSPHFLAKEFSTNESAYPVRHFDRLMRLAGILERCREVSHRSIRITSCWRDPAANARAGGARLSQHMLGRAMDFRDYRGDNAATEKIYRWLGSHLDELGLGGLGWYPVNVPADSPLCRADGPRRAMCRIHVDVRPRLAGQAIARWTH